MPMGLGAMECCGRRLTWQSRKFIAFPPDACSARMPPRIGAARGAFLAAAAGAARPCTSKPVGRRAGCAPRYSGGCCVGYGCRQHALHGAEASCC